jgi:endonuclease/exonuclease/phosphatase family metal-dependent hydrolase
MRVMSFNIRNSHADAHNEHRWDNRKHAVAETIRRFNPDLLGAQECRAEQVDFLTEQFADYDIIGVCRDDGCRAGEAASIAIRRDRFELRDSGTFWLSANPMEIGSVGWDANLPRICTWTTIKDRDAAREMVALNTHYDHLGVIARVESSRLIARWIEERAHDLPTIVIGDFNSDASGESYDALVTGGRLCDTFRVTHPQRVADESTFHRFTGIGRGDRIDWILCSEHFEVLACEIERNSPDGAVASDHFPVTAELRLRG